MGIFDNIFKKKEEVLDIPPVPEDILGLKEEVNSIIKKDKNEIDLPELPEKIIDLPKKLDKTKDSIKKATNKPKKPTVVKIAKEQPKKQQKEVQVKNLKKVSIKKATKPLKEITLIQKEKIINKPAIPENIVNLKKEINEVIKPVKKPTIQKKKEIKVITKKEETPNDSKKMIHAQESLLKQIEALNKKIQKIDNDFVNLKKDMKDEISKRGSKEDALIRELIKKVNEEIKKKIKIEAQLNERINSIETEIKTDESDLGVGKSDITKLKSMYEAHISTVDNSLKIFEEEVLKRDEQIAFLRKGVEEVQNLTTSIAEFQAEYERIFSAVQRMEKYGDNLKLLDDLKKDVEKAKLDIQTSVSNSLKSIENSKKVSPSISKEDVESLKKEIRLIKLLGTDQATKDDILKIKEEIKTINVFLSHVFEAIKLLKSNQQQSSIQKHYPQLKEVVNNYKKMIQDVDEIK